MMSNDKTALLKSSEERIDLNHEYVWSFTSDKFTHSNNRHNPTLAVYESAPILKSVVDETRRGARDARRLVRPPPTAANQISS
jgi:hypothetical protein